jgi:hypothetical protein
MITAITIFFYNLHVYLVVFKFSIYKMVNQVN